VVIKHALDTQELFEAWKNPSVQTEGENQHTITIRHAVTNRKRQRWIGYYGRALEGKLGEEIRS